jgi:L-alanine-DL-glutamate epimerase-like enolase superfamily enzyme
MIDTPILQTELVRGLEVKTDFAAAEATDFLRADPEWDGGITGAIKTARVAEGFGLDVEYHLAGAAQRHLMAATRNSNFYELGLVGPSSGPPHAEPPIYDDYTDRLETVDDDGAFTVPDGPGLGVGYDWDYIEDNALGGRTYE